MAWSSYNSSGAAKTTGSPTFVTSLPTGSDGQEVYYRADDANGIIWHLRFRSVASGGNATYGWEFVGGPPLAVTTGAQVSNLTYPTADVWVNIGAAVSLPGLPLAGDYWVSAISTVFNRVASTSGIGVATTAAGTPTHRTYATSGVTTFVAHSLGQRFDGLAATTAVLTMRYIYNATAGLSVARDGYSLTALPIRVG